MKEERSLTYAKQYFKRNLYKYCDDDCFESATLEYYLRKDEITKLYEYAMKLKIVDKDQVTRRYERMMEEMNK